ncbi:MAG: DUF5362 domain-containing protein [bacterium]|nr:DUF5362 domain-containing protein [bacterium]
MNEQPNPLQNPQWEQAPTFQEKPLSSQTPSHPTENLVENDPWFVQISNILTGTKSWAKFLGVLLIIEGIMVAFSIWGLLFAWLPIWLGVLLYQAGNHAELVAFLRNKEQVLLYLDKMRLFLKISGIFTILMICMAILFIVIAGSAFLALLNSNIEL